MIFFKEVKIMQHNRNAKAAIICAVSLLFVLSPQALAQSEVYNLVVRNIPNGEVTSYKVTYVDQEEKSFALEGDDGIAEKSTYTITRYEDDGVLYYEAHEIESLKGGMYNEFNTVFKAGEYLEMLSYTEELHSFTGKVVRSHAMDYDDPLFDFEGPRILSHAFTFFLRGIDFKEGNRSAFYFHLFGDASPPYRIYADVGPTEEVTVPAGTFECYKVTIVPDLGHILGKWKWAAFIIKPLIPDFFLWYDANEPNRLVRFEGALGIKGITAVQIPELTSYSMADIAQEKTRDAE